MKEIVERLTENRQVELAKSILENAGYTVSKKYKLEPTIEEVLKGLGLTLEKRRKIGERSFDQTFHGQLLPDQAESICSAIESTGNYELISDSIRQWYGYGPVKEYRDIENPNIRIVVEILTSCRGVDIKEGYRQVHVRIIEDVPKKS